MKNKYIYILLALMMFCTVCVWNCSNGDKANLTYTELKMEKTSTEFESSGALAVTYACRIDDKIAAISKGVWGIDVLKGTEALLFRDAVGPNEIYKPCRIRHFGKMFIANSFYSSKFVYSFRSNLDAPGIETKKFRGSSQFDDFQMISESEIAMTNVYWTDGFLKIFNFETGDYSTFEKTSPTKIELMNKFNVNRSSMCVVDNNAFVTQSIVPEIKVIPLKKSEGGEIHDIKLNPPFYAPITEKYDSELYDHKKHKKWMAHWTAVTNIHSYNNWLLVEFTWGYEMRYCYELINLKDKNRRLFISEQPNRIYHFKISEQKALFYGYEMTGEKTVWKKFEASISY